MENDSDMKIMEAAAVSEPAAAEKSGIGETARQHFNGNYSKAKEIGSNIVSAFSYKAAPEEITEMMASFGVEPSETVLRQIRFLSVFSAERCLNTYLPSGTLASVAVGEMYDVLGRVSPEVYAELAQSSAFSFYYMALGRTEEKGLGAVFARLCGDPENKSLAALGDALNRYNCEGYKKAIRSYAFV